MAAIVCVGVFGTSPSASQEPEPSLAAELVDDGVPEVHFETRGQAMAHLSELAFGGDVPYRLEAGWSTNDGRRMGFLIRSDPSFLAESPELPPPIWEDAPGFASEEEIQELFDCLADLPTPHVAQLPTTLRWGFQRPDLLRYNRVEAVSVGVRGQIRPQTFVGPLSVSGTVRVGAADLEPNVRVDATRETLQRKVTLSVFSELATIDEGARHLGPGNSLMALFFGRDDGDYYRRAGASLQWTPPTAERASFRVRAYAEYHRAAGTETDVSLVRLWDHSFAFRPNLLASEGWEYGGSIALSPWWGSDPNLAQGGLELTLQGGLGDVEYARTSLLGRVVLPLPADMRLGLEAGAGTSWGTPSPQRLWYVGGSRTLRGYNPRAGGGTSYGRARVELARTYYFGAVSLFSDLAWAGDRDAVRFDDALYSIGAGVSLLDGLVRIDGAYGLRAPRDFRVDFYLDAIL